MPEAACYSPDGRKIVVSVNNLLPAENPPPANCLPVVCRLNGEPTASLVIADADGSHATVLPDLTGFSFRDTLLGWVQMTATQ